MNLELNKSESIKFKPGSIIIDENDSVFLITNNELDPVCRCSESMGKGYVLIMIDTDAPIAWSIFNKLEDIKECINIKRVVNPESIVIKEVE